jgi:hypothetical protein
VPLAPLQAIVQTLGAVQDAGVQQVTNDVCSQLAQRVTDALYADDATSAAGIIATAFVQGKAAGWLAGWVGELRWRHRRWWRRRRCIGRAL